MSDVAAIWSVEPDAFGQPTLWRWEGPNDETPKAIVRRCDLAVSYRDEGWEFLTARILAVDKRKVLVDAIQNEFHVLGARLGCVPRLAESCACRVLAEIAANQVYPSVSAPPGVSS